MFGIFDEQVTSNLLTRKFWNKNHETSLKKYFPPSCTTADLDLIMMLSVLCYACTVMPCGPSP